MKRMIALCLSAGLLLAGCAKEEKGIGVLPLEGVRLDGKLVESTEAGVLLRTNGGRTALLPDDWEYRQDNAKKDPGALDPSRPVTVFAPSEEGKLVASSGKNLVLSSGDDTYTLPVEAFPESVRQVPVNVQTYGGQTSQVPLQTAVYTPEYTVLSHPGYSDYQFPVAQPHTVSRAYMVGQHNQAPLALVPGPTSLQMVSLPPAVYPVGDLRTNQPVRFNYYDNNVAVSSWNSLQNGEIDLSDILLAGTLLDILPGQAVIGVGSQPVVVPQSFVLHDGRPVAWNSVRTGVPVDVRYYPGVYQVLDYSPEFFTLSYNDNIVQLPIAYLPDTFYQQPVAVYQPSGKVKRLPYGQAKKLIHNGDARLYLADQGFRYRDRWRALDSGKRKGIKGYDQFVVYNQPGAFRVASKDHRKYSNLVYGSKDTKVWNKKAGKGPKVWTGGPAAKKHAKPVASSKAKKKWNKPSKPAKSVSSSPQRVHKMNKPAKAANNYKPRNNNKPRNMSVRTNQGPKNNGLKRSTRAAYKHQAPKAAKGPSHKNRGGGAKAKGNGRGKR